MILLIVVVLGVAAHLLALTCSGLSQTNELYTLPSLGVNSISLNYKWDNKTDQYGNVFRFRSKLNADRETDVGKTAYDVFFVTANPIAANTCTIPAPVSRKAGGR